MKNSSKRIYIIGSFIMVLLIGLSIFLIGMLSNNTKKPQAEDGSVYYTIKVPKITVVSIYVTGQGVNKTSSTLYEDTYTVEEGTKVVLRAVNETKIFTNWLITDETETTIIDNTSTTARLEITPNQNLVVSVNRRDPLISDYGKYMANSFVLTKDSEFLLLQKIFDAGEDISKITNVIDAYEYFFKESSDYQNETNKVSAIANKYFDVIQNGYYLVSHSFSILNGGFEGIGNETYPFKGVICGLNNNSISNLFLTITDVAETETGNLYRGLFKIIDNNALIRNLNINMSIGVNDTTNSTGVDNVYAGGVAGINNGAIIINSKVTTRHSIICQNANIYAGSIAGMTNNGSIDDISDITCNQANSAWIIETKAIDKNIYAGVVSGKAINTYVKKIVVKADNFSIGTRNNSSNVYSSSTNIYLGTLFGQYIAESPMRLENIDVNSNDSVNYRALISTGNAYVSPFIGYINASSDIIIGKVTLNFGKAKAMFNATTIDLNSKGNVYVGGLAAKVEGNNLKANDDFKLFITKESIDGKSYNKYGSLFTGNVTIEAMQNGTGDGSTYGKAITGGLIAKGYFDINGDVNKKSEIILNDQSSTLNIKSIQSSTASTTNSNKSDIEHCISGLVFGIISENSIKGYNFEYINIYANNANIISTRELDSRNVGDLHTSGFVTYANGGTFSNIKMLLNKNVMESNSLSYAVQYGSSASSIEGNNTFTSSFIAEAKGATVDNILITSYDYEKEEEIGTDLKISAIQNSQTGQVNKNYYCENYVGGLIGRLFDTNVTNCIYYGSLSEDDYIQMQGHQSPDSAFIGGLIGFIKNSSTVTISSNRIINVTIYGSATSTNTSYSNPDIYVGGVIGAAYFENSSIARTIKLDDNYLCNCDIVGIGNERIEVYVGGIIAGLTWASSTTTISNCYVYGSKIVATTSGIKNNGHGKAYAGGICPYVFSASRAVVKNSVVISTEIKSTSQSEAAYAYGLTGGNGSANSTINNCYTNADISASGSNGSYVYPIADALNNNSAANYYVKQNITNITSSTYGTALDFSTKSFTTSQAVDIFTEMENSDKYSNKYYPIIKGKDKFEVAYNSGSVTTISRIKTNVTDVAEIWINAKSSGSSSRPNNSIWVSKDTIFDDGWFKLGEVMLVSGTSSNDAYITDYRITYSKDDALYEYKDGMFVNKNYPYNSVEKIGYEEADTNELFNGKKIHKEITIKLIDRMPNLNIGFTSTGTSSSEYQPVFYDKDGNEITNFSLEYFGVYNYEYIENTNLCTYEFTFVPNIDYMQNNTFYLQFKVGSSDQYSLEIIKINLICNTINLVGGTYVDYTKPLNYDEENIGTSGKPYLIRKGSTTKFIPIITRGNDENNTRLIDELNVDKVTYSVDGGGTINANGEFKANANDSSTTTYIVTIKLKNSDVSIKLYFKLVDKYDVTYASIGSTIDALTYATSDANYYILKSTNLEHYGGFPKKFDVAIGSVTYDLNEIITKGWIYDKTGQTINAWDVDVEYYELRIPQNSITGTINIDIELNIVYSINFELQCENFNPNFSGNKSKTFKVIAGTKFGEYFTDKIQKEISSWVDSARVFGYVPNGFYLVDSANTVESYGDSLDKIIENNIEIQTSYSFYARWSFLIEIIEAPGTNVVTSFPDSFMYKYGKDISAEMTDEEIAAIKKYNESLSLNRAVTIPINNNRGYIFTIVKDKGFIGEAEVKAYIVSKDSNSSTEKIIKEINVEKYHENMYLYYIAPEKITGYLVIVTSVSNSEIIVGENTAKVSDEILPEDGIYTFKYIVNHRNTEDSKSYIYDSGLTNRSSNLSLTKDLLIQFMKQTYDLTGRAINADKRNLPAGTTIKVFYNKYVNGTKNDADTTVGIYTVTSKKGISEVKLSEFTKLNKNEKAFEDITFEELLGDNESVSEVYYFVITPPNGYNMYDDEGYIDNNMIYVGYLDEAREDRYVHGVRSKEGLANIPLEDQDISHITEPLLFETSCQQKLYSVTPSRNTTLVKNSNINYTFTDYTKYSIISFDILNADVMLNDGIIKMYDDVNKNSIIKSHEIINGILELELVLGYGKGDIVIYASKTGSSDSYVHVATITVDDFNYKTYKVTFDASEDYHYFMIDNASQNEIHLSKIGYSEINKGLLYEFKVSDLVQKTTSGTTYTVMKDIVGDSRHDGKSFILAIQYKNGNDIVSNLPSTGISITINGVTYLPYENDLPGRHTAYYDLSSILKDLDLSSIEITINIPDGYTISTIELLEAKSIQKPSMAEIRTIYTF